MQKRGESGMIRVGLDTSFAGTNTTGVGLYSRRLCQELTTLGPELGIIPVCVGPSCSLHARNGLWDTAQEWPPFTQLAVPLLLSRHRPHVIHSTSHLGPLFGAPRRIVTVHDLLFQSYPRDYNPFWLAISKGLLPVVLKRATRVVTDSKATALDLRRYYKVAPAKICVIYPGIDAVNLDGRSQHEWYIESVAVPKDPYIICLGPWVGRKNLGVVVQAFERVARQDELVHLVLTGERPRGMKGHNVEESLERLPRDVRARVQLPGHVSTSTLRRIMAGAAVLAYPSRFEGFGLPPLEAMSAGVPVVASRSPAILEVSGDAALYAPPDDPSVWSEQLLRALNDPTTRTLLIARGRERHKEFTWERCARECGRLYKEVVRL